MRIHFWAGEQRSSRLFSACVQYSAMFLGKPHVTQLAQKSNTVDELMNYELMNYELMNYELQAPNGTLGQE